MGLPGAFGAIMKLFYQTIQDQVLSSAKKTKAILNNLAIYVDTDIILAFCN